MASEVAAVAEDPHVWISDDPDSTMYSLDRNFDCCTVNFLQQWPRFIQRMVYATPDGGIAIAALGPVSAALPHGGPRVVASGDYPFEDIVSFALSDLAAHPVTGAVATPVYLRVPSWATGATLAVNGGSPYPLGAAARARCIACLWIRCQPWAS